MTILDDYHGCPSTAECEAYCKSLGDFVGLCTGMMTACLYILFLLQFVSLTIKGTPPVPRNMCPANWKACDQQCRAVGRRGGYCGGLWSTRCTCIVRSVSITSDVLPVWG
ncbi:defensin BmKDfsin6-like isoform X2 [Argiope bruennichi]|uniref:defensin BmKDfsin6-like isoform X2 n=1 Tax=Argiope bruennichi TaxID=94029 RepID=UPI0024946D7B|nr:defensin BmKDfsin6-like isoform X2 [Argiope bruennichi]